VSIAEAGQALEQIPHAWHFSMFNLTSPASSSNDIASKGQTDGQIIHLPQLSSFILTLASFDIFSLGFSVIPTILELTSADQWCGFSLAAQPRSLQEV
jgi:hypothetical protein